MTIPNPTAVAGPAEMDAGLRALAVILGVCVLVWPGISILVAATLFGVYLLVSTLSPRFHYLHDTVAD